MPPEPQPSASPDAGKILHIVAELEKVMEEEISLLAKRVYGGQPHILRRKQELNLHYQAVLKGMASHPDRKNLFKPAEREKLAAAGKRLEAVTRKNAEAIRLAQACSERLLQSMMDSIRSEMKRESGYSRDAVLIMAQRNAAPPIALNQRV